MESDTEMGPLISKAHLNRVDGFINRAKNNSNVKLLTGGKVINRRGHFFEQRLLQELSKQMRLFKRKLLVL
jgi:aminobutyraldehyde dehydrogenase